MRLTTPKLVALALLTVPIFVEAGEYPPECIEHASDGGCGGCNREYATVKEECLAEGWSGTEPLETSSSSTLPTTTLDPSTSSSETTMMPMKEASSSSEGSSDGDGSSTTLAPDFCGDGNIGPDEVCDDGINDGGYGGCQMCMALGPHCNDGNVDPEEECDEDSDLCIGCVRNVLRVFVTSTTKAGDFGGIKGAESWCHELAVAAGLEPADAFKPWVGTNSTDPFTTFQAPQEFTGNYVLLDPEQTVVAHGWEGLINLEHTINITEKGVPGPKNMQVWSRVDTQGKTPLQKGDCLSWTSITSQMGDPLAGLVGDPNQLGTWTMDGSVGCDAPLHIYCFEDRTIPQD